MINNFRIFKVKEHDGNAQKYTHYISTTIGEEFVSIGKCWTKEGANNSKFLSCQLDGVYRDKPGYQIELVLPEPNKTEKTVGLEGEEVNENPF